MKYLSKLQTVGKPPVQVYAQHIQVDTIQLRCHYCIYRDDCKNLGSLTICSRKHGCDNYSSMFAQLEQQLKSTIEDDDKFQPSAITKTITVDYIKRHLQYIYSLYEGYNCYRNCYFYPYIAGGQQSIFSCASSHGCGANSNFFTLLQMVDDLENMRITAVDSSMHTIYVTGYHWQEFSGYTLLVFDYISMSSQMGFAIARKIINGTPYYLKRTSSDDFQMTNLNLSGSWNYVNFGGNHDLLWLLYFNRFNWYQLFQWLPDTEYDFEFYAITANKVSHTAVAIRSKEVSESILDGDETLTLSGYALVLVDSQGNELYLVPTTGPYKRRLLMIEDGIIPKYYWSDVVLPSTSYFGKNVTVPLNNDTIITIRNLVANGLPEDILIF